MNKLKNITLKLKFYGWYVVAILFFSSALGVGSRQAFGLFVDPWATDFGVSVFTISAIASIGWVANGLAQPVVGKLTDRYGGRLVMSISMLILGAASVLLVIVSNIWALAFFHAIVISTVVSGIMFTPAAVLVSKWFLKRRGTAMGVVTAGGSIGSMLMIPFMAYLLILGGWRLSILSTAVIMLVIAFPCLLFILRNSPEELGLEQDGSSVSSDGLIEHPGKREGPLTAERWPQCFRSSPLWLLGGSYVVCGVTTAMIGVHFVPYSTSEGIDVSVAAWAFGLLSLMNLLGVLSAGWLSDYMPRKNLLGSIYLVRGLAFIFLAFMPASYGIWVFVAVAGVSWLATVPLTSALAAEIYGLKHVGVVVGFLTMAHQFGGAAAVLLAGISFTFLGSYLPAFLGGALLLILAGISSLSVRERQVSVRYQTVSVGLD